MTNRGSETMTRAQLQELVAEQNTLVLEQGLQIDNLQRSLDEARHVAEEMHSELAATRRNLQEEAADRAQLSAKVHEASDRCEAADKCAADVRKQNAELKQRLHAAELMLARQEGYLDRVREDDFVRDGQIEIGRHEKVDTRPLRPPPAATLNSMSGAMGNGRDARFDPRPDHDCSAGWLNY